MSFIDKLKHLSDEKGKKDSPDKSISSHHKNFKYLNDLISGDEKEIILNCDIILDKEDIHLLIMDIMMPGLSGVEACQEIRRRCSVPVLFLTAKSQESDKQTAYHSGGRSTGASPMVMAARMAATTCSWVVPS